MSYIGTSTARQLSPKPILTLLIQTNSLSYITVYGGMGVLPILKNDGTSASIQVNSI